MDPAEIVEARFVAAAATVASLPPPVGIEIVFAGRSNVGKSSLLNALLARRSLARTSSTPGCTRTVTFFEARARDDTRLTLVDLPGYGYAARSRTERQQWAELIEGYLLDRPTLKAATVLVDARRGLEPDDQDLFKLLGESGSRGRPLPSVLVATKLDKVVRAQRASVLARLAQQNDKVVGFSTELPETTLQVWHALRAAIL